MSLMAHLIWSGLRGYPAVSPATRVCGKSEPPLLPVNNDGRLDEARRLVHGNLEGVAHLVQAESVRDQITDLETAGGQEPHPGAHSRHDRRDFAEVGVDHPERLPVPAAQRNLAEPSLVIPDDDDGARHARRIADVPQGRLRSRDLEADVGADLVPLIDISERPGRWTVGVRPHDVDE